MPRRPALLLPLLFVLAACAATPRRAAVAVPEAASRALAEARRLSRAGAGREDPALVEALARARAAAPGWAAPMRLEDDLALGARLDVRALEARRAQWRTAPGDAVLAYLVGRLEGPAGAPRFERAAELDPELAWAQHGLAWAAARDGDAARAARLEARAAALALDPWERAFFAVARAGFLQRLAQSEQAMTELRETLADADALERADRLWLESEVALVELRQGESTERLRGRRRALELLRQEDLADADLLRLVDALRSPLASVEALDGELELALAATRGPLRDALRAGRMHARGPSSLARRLLAELHGDPDAALATLDRPLRFAVGDFRPAVEDWLRELPEFLKDEAGLPRDEALARLVTRARALDSGADGEALAAFGDALVGAGWFVEARAVSEALAPRDLDAALSLRARALAGLDLIEALRRALSDSRREERLSGRAGPDGAPQEGGLEGLLDHLGVVLADANAWLGGERDPEAVSRMLLDSPRLSYGPFATLVHPGPRFSPADEAAGLGEAGAPVAGLAAQMARLGRFGVIGEYLGGGGPDGVVLQRLLVEERAGEHLGVPWRGTIAWCEGVDLEARATRAGATITGAAVHEGYWIALDPVRRDLRSWRALEREYSGPGARARLEEVLAARGLELEAPPGHERRRGFERTRIAPALGEADRVRLALLRDRAADPASEAAPLGAMTLEELLRNVARHEEGHLCDRTLFLPIGANLPRALALLFEEGFSPAGVLRRLEYRAQLVALCVAEDPRLPLVDLLIAAEGEGDGPLPHAGAYRELLADLLRLLDAALERDPEAWPTLDRDRTLVHQLHHLRPGELRTLALRLARKKGVGRS